MVLVVVGAVGIFLKIRWDAAGRPPPSAAEVRVADLQGAYARGKDDAKAQRRLTPEQMQRLGWDHETQAHYRAGWDDGNYAR